MLRCHIPAAKMERLDSALDVFQYLENLQIVGPNIDKCGMNELKELFSLMQKPKLARMVAEFDLFEAEFVLTYSTTN